MKRNLLFVITFLFSIFTCVTTFAAEESYKIDPSHTFVLWHIDHLGFSTQTGKWPVNGTVLIDENDPQKSKVDVVIKVADMITGNAELNKHLEGESFFDTKKYPTATFVSNKVEITSKTTANLQGVLTLRGVAKPVTLNVALIKIGKNPVTEKPTAGFSATTTIKRSDFGINAFLPMLGDSVKLDIDVEAQKAEAQKVAK